MDTFFVMGFFWPKVAIYWSNWEEWDGWIWVHLQNILYTFVLWEGQHLFEYLYIYIYIYVYRNMMKYLDLGVLEA